MPKRVESELLSSPSTLQIAGMLSTRPRTLTELSHLTGTSVQGVLKHLAKLGRIGVLGQKRVRGEGARKLYYLKDYAVGAYGASGLTVVKVSPRPKGAEPEGKALARLEELAEETIVLRRRIEEKARRLARAIDDLQRDEAEVSEILESLELSEEDRLVLHAVFTEETSEDAEKVLSRDFGIADPKREIASATRRARRRE